MKNKNQYKKIYEKGISLISLVITIIVLLILAGVGIGTLTGDSGIIKQAGDAKEKAERKSILEQIEVAFISLENNRFETDKEKLEALRNKLEIPGAEYEVSSKSMTISTKQGYKYTILADGELLEGNLVCLDIADGSIDLKSNGYIQNNEPLVEYTGKYIITGTTTENVVRIMEKGTYDITIKDLDIKVSKEKQSSDGRGYCAFNANRGSNATGCYVNLTLEGNNYLYGSGEASGLGFSNATPNIDGITDGSTLTIQGEGSLEAKGAFYAAGIGSGYSGWEVSAGQVSNIIINSGNIKTTGGTHGAGIGSALHGKVNNIIINGGNIEAIGDSYGCGIGASTLSSNSTVDNIIINGGNIKAISGPYGAGIGGGKNASGSGTIKITGGNIYATASTKKNYEYAVIGHGCEFVKIEGGTIRTYTTVHAGIYGGANVEITGGNLLLNGLGDIGTLDENKNFVKSIATNGESDIYLTKIKLTNAKGNEKVTELKTSDNILYGIKDMYVAIDDENTADIDETGMIYLYLPKGSRTITLTADGKNYSGTVETTEEGSVSTLSLK